MTEFHAFLKIQMNPELTEFTCPQGNSGHLSQMSFALAELLISKQLEMLKLAMSDWFSLP